MTRQEVLMTFAQGCRKILQGDLSKLIVYGSYARGDYREDSDIDVMILTPLSNQQIERWRMLFLILLSIWRWSRKS